MALDRKIRHAKRRLAFFRAAAGIAGRRVEHYRRTFRHAKPGTRRRGRQGRKLVAWNKRRAWALSHAVFWKRRLRRLQRVVPHTPLQGIDYYGSGSLAPSAIRAAHKAFVCRYIAHQSGKCITKTEVDELRAGRVNLVTVFEDTGTDITDGFAAGARDAEFAKSIAGACGNPDAVIYFAADEEVDPVSARAYYEGAAHVLGEARTGVYGEYALCKYLIDEHIVKYAWQTYAWSGGAWDGTAQLRQYLNGANVAGVEVDLDEAVHPDYGQWFK